MAENTGTLKKRLNVAKKDLHTELIKAALHLPQDAWTHKNRYGNIEYNTANDHGTIRKNHIDKVIGQKRGVINKIEADFASHPKMLLAHEGIKKEDPHPKYHATQADQSKAANDHENFGANIPNNGDPYKEYIKASNTPSRDPQIQHLLGLIQQYNANTDPAKSNVMAHRIDSYAKSTKNPKVESFASNMATMCTRAASSNVKFGKSHLVTVEANMPVAYGKIKTVAKKHLRQKSLTKSLRKGSLSGPYRNRQDWLLHRLNYDMELSDLVPKDATAAGVNHKPGKKFDQIQSLTVKKGGTKYTMSPDVVTDKLADDAPDRLAVIHYYEKHPKALDNLDKKRLKNNKNFVYAGTNNNYHNFKTETPSLDGNRGLDSAAKTDQYGQDMYVNKANVNAYASKKHHKPVVGMDAKYRADINPNSPLAGKHVVTYVDKHGNFHHTQLISADGFNRIREYNHKKPFSIQSMWKHMKENHPLAQAASNLAFKARTFTTKAFGAIRGKLPHLINEASLAPSRIAMNYQREKQTERIARQRRAERLRTRFVARDIKHVHHPYDAFNYASPFEIRQIYGDDPRAYRYKEDYKSAHNPYSIFMTKTPKQIDKARGRSWRPDYNPQKQNQSQRQGQAQRGAQADEGPSL